MMLSFIAVPRWLNFPLGAIQVLAAPEDIESLTFEVLETGRVGESQQMTGGKYRLGHRSRYGSGPACAAKASAIRVDP